MRFLYSRTQATTGARTGGALAHTLGVIDGLARCGQLRLLTNEPLHGLDSLDLQISARVIKPSRPGALGELFFNFEYPPQLTGELAKFRPDFVYHRFGGLSFATTRICHNLSIPLVLEFNSSPIWGLRQRHTKLANRPLLWLKGAVLRPIERYNLQKATLVVVPGRPLKAHLVQQGIPESKILFNPNAVNVDKFRPAPAEVCAGIRRQLGIDADKTVVGFAGTFGPWHGLFELAQAIELLNANPERERQLFFVLIGDGALCAAIEERIGGFKNVFFAGRVDFNHIQDYLSICNILLSPHGKLPDDSRSIGWPGASPTKVFEYMALGKGIVASNLDYIGDVIRNGETGVSIPPGDVDALVDGITFLANHPHEAQRLGQNASRKVREQHTWYHHACRIVDKFVDLTAEPGPGSHP